MEFTYYDQVIAEALRRRKKVTLFLCKDEEGGFGIKIDGKEILRNEAWEVFEYHIEFADQTKINKLLNSEESRK